MNLTEKTKSSEYIFKGRIINLRRDVVILPNGSESGREVIEHNGGSRLQNELNNKILVDSAKIIFRHEGTHTFIFGGLLNTDSLTGGEDFGSDYSNEY